ncbi:hypothetical protein Avbf_10630 [Armadillidium vulgare]|nr:hypothetical protein Avbf_10630 [Armadillidium vulgare]
MVSSLPVWALCFAHSGSMFGLGAMLTQLPIYLNSIIGLNIKAEPVYGMTNTLAFSYTSLGPVIIGAFNIRRATVNTINKLKRNKKVA